MFNDVKLFCKKYALQIVKKPGLASKELMQARMIHLQEEVNEINKAYKQKDIVEIFDGLIDLVYVALGTAANMNLPFEKGWQKVHDANMKKVKATKITKRKTKHDVVKPKGWRHPNLKILLVNKRKK